MLLSHHYQPTRRFPTSLHSHPKTLHSANHLAGLSRIIWRGGSHNPDFLCAQQNWQAATRTEEAREARCEAAALAHQTQITSLQPPERAPSRQRGQGPLQGRKRHPAQEYGVSEEKHAPTRRSSGRTGPFKREKSSIHRINFLVANSLCR